MIRKAVGAIVTAGEKYLLIHKAKINTLQGKQRIEGEWDFIKGGMEKSDLNPASAIKRELREETGSDAFTIQKELEEKIIFTFPEKTSERIGFHSQETIMFLVKFHGKEEDLLPEDEEISQIGFFSQEEVMDKLAHVETKQYLKQYLD
jgi:putative (di)nucleoside polyphosphate hydrolase